MTKTTTKTKTQTKCLKNPSYAIFLKSWWLTHSKYDDVYLTLVILFTPVTLVTLFQSYNQFYRAECITVSGFFCGKIGKVPLGLHLPGGQPSFIILYHQHQSWIIIMQQFNRWAMQRRSPTLLSQGEVEDLKKESDSGQQWTVNIAIYLYLVMWMLPPLLQFLVHLAEHQLSCFEVLGEEYHASFDQSNLIV